MKLEQPALGIMKTSQWKDAEAYRIACDCQHTDHDVNAWIEIDSDSETRDVQVAFFVETWTPFWDKKFNRFKAAWNILVKGVNRQEHHIILSKQAAYNFAGTIEQAVKRLDQKAE